MKNKRYLSALSIFLLWSSLESAYAVEIEPTGKALLAILGTPKVVKKSLKASGKPVELYIAKDAAGKSTSVAFIQKGVYEPNCTHTWAVGINPSDGKVSQVRVIEMSCAHAFPTRATSFLDQYKGKGIADVATLDSSVSKLAKATGSSKLATDAVKLSITAFNQIKGQI